MVVNTNSHSGIFSLYMVNDNALPQGCYMKYLFSRFAAENLLVFQYIYVLRISYTSYVSRILCVYRFTKYYLGVILTANKRAK